MSTETLTGTVERIVFTNPANGWTVLDLAPGNGRSTPLSGWGIKSDTVTVVGVLPDPHPGETLELRGAWQKHPRYGRQFKAEHCQVARPATLEGIERYLGSSLIEGVGPVTAKAIVEHFGTDTLQVLDDEPERLTEVEGVGPKRAVAISVSWEEQKAIKDVMIFLAGLGVTTGLAVKIYKAYGGDAIGVIQRNPYRLALDIRGVGFKQADRIARSQGLPLDSSERFQAGLVYALEMATNLGHVYLPRQELAAQAAELLIAPPELPHVPPEALDEAIEALSEALRVKRETVEDGVAPAPRCTALARCGAGEAVYLPPYYYAETGVAERLEGALSVPTARLRPFSRVEDWEAFLDSLSSDTPLTAQQRQAVRTALTHQVTVVTGGPGTGKTTTMQAVIAALEAKEVTYALAAPTGRAAKRLSEAAGREAQTVHRMLGWGLPEELRHNEANPLPVDMLVVDEASMLDLLLAHQLLKAVHPSSHLLLVGDVDQLPSVGAGNVLRDIIDSRKVATVRLDLIFRQAEGSHIIANAHRVNRGESPVANEGQDFFLFTKDDPAEAAARVVDVVANRIPHKFGLDPLADVQVLAPMRKGEAGVNNLNQLLQQALNPARPGKRERRLGHRVLRVGDKLMQIRNNYDKDVFNGDIGRLVGIDEDKKRLTVEIDGRPVAYEWAEADELVHAFATTIHKAQGSEFPAVVMPLMTQHYMLLQRNLLYTGITRAKKLVVLVGQHKAIAMAVSNDKVARRHTALCWRLRGSDEAESHERPR